MPNIELFLEANGTWIVWNKCNSAEFQVVFPNKEQAMQFISDFMFKFYTDRVN